jgi:NAD(P)-dependent dehydrogenase (short-subunit alcohol dehydrogenase family)
MEWRKVKETAVIVGGSGEIGSMVAKKLSYEYNTICIHKNPHSVNMFQKSMDICADMTDPVQIENIVKNIKSKYKTIDVLINCIGKNIAVPLDKLDLQIWKDVIDTNLQSIFFLCKIIGTEMVKQKSGVIVNFASTAGIKPLPKSPHYIAAKSGVIALTKYYAQIYAPFVRVNAVAPGYILTKSHIRDAGNTNIIDKIPLERMATVEEIVNTVKHIIESSYMTGEIVVVDGGLTL